MGNFKKNIKKENLKSGTIKKPRKIYNRERGKYIEEFETEEEALNFFHENNLDEEDFSIEFFKNYLQN